VEKKLSGIFHIGGGTPISWFDYAKLIFEAAQLTPELRPTTEREHRTPARRPKYSALSNAKMERCGVTPMPSMRAAVEDYMSRRKLVAAGA
jgi:dTDP-4-dehydrorhamnose reductase